MFFKYCISLLQAFVNLVICFLFSPSGLWETSRVHRVFLIFSCRGTVPFLMIMFLISQKYEYIYIYEHWYIYNIYKYNVIFDMYLTSLFTNIIGEFIYQIWKKHIFTLPVCNMFSGWTLCQAMLNILHCVSIVFHSHYFCWNPLFEIKSGKEVQELFIMNLIRVEWWMTSFMCSIIGWVVGLVSRYYLEHILLQTNVNIQQWRHKFIIRIIGSSINLFILNIINCI